MALGLTNRSGGGLKLNSSLSEYFNKNIEFSEINL
jgi:hypothetical protein